MQLRSADLQLQYVAPTFRSASESGRRRSSLISPASQQYNEDRQRGRAEADPRDAFPHRACGGNLQRDQPEPEGKQAEALSPGAALELQHRNGERQRNDEVAGNYSLS